MQVRLTWLIFIGTTTPEVRPSTPSTEKRGLHGTYRRQCQDEASGSTGGSKQVRGTEAAVLLNQH